MRGLLSKNRSDNSQSSRGSDSGVSESSEWDNEGNQNTMAHTQNGPRVTYDPFDYGLDKAWSFLDQESKNDSKRHGDAHGPKGHKSGDKHHHHHSNGVVPNGIPGNNIKIERYTNGIDAKQPMTGTIHVNFLVEHLGSSALQPGETFVSGKERLKDVKQTIVSLGNWTREMEMRITEDRLFLLDGGTQEMIEVYKLLYVDNIHSLTGDPHFNSVLVFTTSSTESVIGAVHLFQCDRVPAEVVASELQKAVAKNKTSGTGVTSPHPGGMMLLPPPPSQPAPFPPKTDLREKSLVAETIAAFQNARGSNNQVQKTYSNDGGSPLEESLNGGINIELVEARTNRDVQILNHCIDDIEALIDQAKKSAEAWKKIKNMDKKKKKKMSRAEQTALDIASAPPRESEYIDAFQKFKYAFNLLGKLRPHIHNPNAAELVHYLFPALGLLVQCAGGIAKASIVVAPLLTPQAVDLLNNCLNSKEMEFWVSLGPYWKLPKNHEKMKDVNVPPYAPVFRDGWVPPEYIVGKDGQGLSVPSNISAAVAAGAAAMKAKKQDEHDGVVRTSSGGNVYSNPTVLMAAAKFKSGSKKDVGRAKEGAPNVAQKPPIFKRMKVQYTFSGRNDKELSVKEGEELQVLDDSRQWWCVRNNGGEVGYVPHTVLQQKPDTRSTPMINGQLPTPPQTPPPPPPTSQNQHQVEKLRSPVVKSTHPSELSRQNPHQFAIPPLRRVSNENIQTSAPQTRTSSQSSSSPPRTPTPQSKEPIGVTVYHKNSEGQKMTPPLSPPPPPPAPPPPPPPEQEQPATSQVTLRPKKNAQPNEDDKTGSMRVLNDELKRRISMPSPMLNNRPQRTTVPPPTENATPQQVSDWLANKGFTPNTVEKLKGKSAGDLAAFEKENLKRLIGDKEGAKLYSQVQIWKGRWSFIEVKKGVSELEVVMKRRKEVLDDPSLVNQSGGGIRNIVANAKDETSETQYIKQTGDPRPRNLSIISTASSSSTTSSGSQLAPPSSGPEDSTTTESFYAAVKKPALKKNKVPVPRPISGEIAPPVPPALYETANGGPKVSPKRNSMEIPQTNGLSTQQQPQQQQLQMELYKQHQEQVKLLEKLQKQKEEIEQQKRKYEEEKRQQKIKEQQQKEQIQLNQLKEDQKKLSQQIESQQKILETTLMQLQQRQTPLTMMQPQSVPMMQQQPQAVPMMQQQPQAVPMMQQPQGIPQMAYGAYPQMLPMTGVYSTGITMPPMMTTNIPRMSSTQF